MAYLIETTEIYRVDSESEAKTLIEKAKKSSIVSKYSCVHKEKKQKGEVVDDWFRVTITKFWTNEKEPDSCTTVSYGIATSNFPEVDEDED